MSIETFHRALQSEAAQDDAPLRLLAQLRDGIEAVRERKTKDGWIPWGVGGGP